MPNLRGIPILLLVAAVVPLASPARADQILDLTTQNASVTATAVIGGTFIETQDADLKSATGIFNPFVRIQNNGTEQGYNTSLGTPLDDKSGTQAIQLSDVAIETVGGVDYRVFSLGINQDQDGSNALLSLNQIQIFQTNQDQLATGVTPASSSSAPVISFASATEVFQVNNANDPNFLETQLNSSLSNGNATGDMVLYVPNSDFQVAYGSNVILYSQFGDPPGTSGSNGGFEEWGVNGNNQLPTVENFTATPEPSTIALAASSLPIGLVLWLKRRRKARTA